jgi:hypothetical protein
LNVKIQIASLKLLKYRHKIFLHQFFVAKMDQEAVKRIIKKKYFEV